MTDTGSIPPHYRQAVRTVLRFAIVMSVVALLVGISFQESTRKLDFTKAAAGLHIEAVLPLGLVHGHLFVMTVILPIALLGALFLGLRTGGGPVTPRALRWLTSIYLPFATGSAALLLYKGYHVLLHVRAGATDLAPVDAAFFGGVTWLRYGVYGLVHAGMGVGLVAFLVCLWRSLGPSQSAAK